MAGMKQKPVVGSLAHYQGEVQSGIPGSLWITPPPIHNEMKSHTTSCSPSDEKSHPVSLILHPEITPPPTHLAPRDEDRVVVVHHQLALGRLGKRGLVQELVEVTNLRG
jgi:hypothetical protein